VISVSWASDLGTFHSPSSMTDPDYEPTQQGHATVTLSWTCQDETEGSTSIQIWQYKLSIQSDDGYSSTPRPIPLTLPEPEMTGPGNLAPFTDSGYPHDSGRPNILWRGTCRPHGQASSGPQAWAGCIVRNCQPAKTI
jgi:hypothetical protein